MAGVLAANGVNAAAAGDISAQIYGGVSMLDCVVIVPEEELEEAEAVLRTGFTEEPPAPDIPAETCPPDGDPPGIRIILYGTARLAPWAALIPTLLVWLQLTYNSHYTWSELFRLLPSLYLRNLLFLVFCLFPFSIGAGILLHILRKRRGHLVFKMAFTMIYAASLLSVIAKLILTHEGLILSR